jgi:hypothetical protein
LRCPAGNYCPEGSESPVQCPIGTFGEGEGASKLSQCKPCPPGYACIAAGLVNPISDVSKARQCPAGFYCEYGTESIDASNVLVAKTACEEGFECPLDSEVKRACQRGYYQDLTE